MLAQFISTGILVRIVVPRIGELNSMRLGLIAFSLQCLLVAVSTNPAWIFLSVLFSMGANLFYPAVSSLVSKVVSEDSQGEALGALNGIKALVRVVLSIYLCGILRVLVLAFNVVSIITHFTNIEPILILFSINYRSLPDGRLWSTLLWRTDEFIRAFFSTWRPVYTGNYVIIMGVFALF